MTQIYSVLNTKLQTIFSGLVKVKSIYPYPPLKIDSYPAVMYFPAGFENDYDSTAENMKVYRYKVWVVCSTGNTTVSQIFSSVMPNVLDEVLQAIDSGWNFDTIAGHRCWCKVDQGQWSVDQTQGGVEVSAEIELSVRVLTNI